MARGTTARMRRGGSSGSNTSSGNSISIFLGDNDDDDVMVSLSPKPTELTPKKGSGSSGSGPQPPTLPPMEIIPDDDDDDAAGKWRSMDVRSSQESPLGFIRRTRVLAVVATALALFLFAAFALLSRGGRASRLRLVAPVYGTAYLAPEEFRDVRSARPGESVLVTGGLGFIGSHVVDLLLHRGFDVTILDDESNGHNHNRYARELVPHDITVVGDLPEFPSGKKGEEGKDAGRRYTHVIHLAAAISVAESMTDPAKYERINFDGSQKVLDWIGEYNKIVTSNDRGGGPIKKLVAASSAAIYGDPDPSLLPLREEAGYGGLSPYADTKFRMEGSMRKFLEKQRSDNNGPADTGAVALRFFNVYGPRQDPKNPYSGVISLFLEAALRGKDITVLGDGLMTRDFVYVKDVARAIVLALLQEGDAPPSFAVYNVCTGTSITINTLAEQVKRSMGSQSEITHLDPRDGDIRESSCNPGGARGGIGFQAAVSQEGGLEKTADWFRQEDDAKR